MDHEECLDQHGRMLADHHLEMAQLRASQSKTEAALRRAIRLGVAEARSQRRNNAEFKEAMTRLATAVELFSQRGTNGKH
jgi:hypothetical protein